MSPTNIETEALVVAAPGDDFKLVPIILDEVRGNEVLVEMKYSGICHTDLVVQSGQLPIPEYPVVLGHEGAGIVRAIGADFKDKSLQVGDQVLLSWTTCQKCTACLEGRPTFCILHASLNFKAVRLQDGSTPARLRDDGTAVRGQFFGHSSFARLSVVEGFSVVKCPVPDMLPCYAPLGCAFQTGAGTILSAVKPSKSACVVIFGLGSVGLAALMAAAHLEVRQLVAVDVVDSKLALATEFGATHTVNAAKEGDGLVSRLKEITGGGPDVAIDCSGNPRALQAVLDCIGYGGTAVSVGVPPPGCKLTIDALPFFMDNKTFRSVIEGQSTPTEFLPELIKLHQNGRFPIDKICKVYSIKDFKEALQDMHEGKVIKPILKWD
ncbi:hypothetical protein M406DRAFT_94894 [Cryphonectria parasitica EP155]|uniref:Enoyl reductase (ER) domain-containing protein n=1 Tax=Cryphonectria parasitica (strain ATCC 38755 / EP155) TaxID=660469 RepID=A0A9P4XVL9_CRYP1|nr:uncharacterized protein M406DRAFT_94894 [Cryphonectria parasitica EP155]KAF3761590.1 hypothetical protein M406DRAFT_94894 [Cryphonectria parasitica EP155]